MVLVKNTVDPESVISWLQKQADLNQHVFFKKKTRTLIRVSNGLYQDQARYSVGLDLGPNCLQRRLSVAA